MTAAFVVASACGRSGASPAAAFGTSIDEPSAERTAAVALGTTGPLVVFLPGLGGTTEYWRPLADSVASGARVLLVDPLGFGASAKPGGRYSMARHVAALDATLRGGPAAILVGHSFGARLAIAYAARHPARVRALVLYGLAYYGDPIATRAFFQSGAVARRWIFADEQSTALACLISRRLLGPMLPMFAPDLPTRVVTAASTHTWRSSSSTFWSTIMEYDLGPDIDALPARLPVHLVHGAQDRTAPLDRVRALAARHPDWTLLVLPTAGHHAWWTTPDAAREVLDAAIAQGRKAGNPGAGG